MYATICNNPRGIQYLREETMLLVMFPGPREPTQEQWNNVMDICVKHLNKLYNGEYFSKHCGRPHCTLGVYFKVYGKAECELFHAQLGSDVSDLIASRKTCGLLAVTSKWFMCDHCDEPFYALVDRDAYDSSSKIFSSAQFILLKAL
jgi:hypothetical protein